MREQVSQPVPRSLCLAGSLLHWRIAEPALVRTWVCESHHVPRRRRRLGRLAVDDAHEAGGSVPFGFARRLRGDYGVHLHNTMRLQQW